MCNNVFHHSKNVNKLDDTFNQHQNDRTVMFSHFIYNRDIIA